MITLEGRRALVTGGSRGIGRATALLLAQAGADVAVICRQRVSEAEAVVAEIRAMGRKAWCGGGDLADPTAAEALVDAAAHALGGLDILVANAGVWPPEEVPLGELSLDRWRHTLAANLDALFLTVRAALARMPEGAVVLVSSTAGQRGEAFHADYAASKGAVISLTKSLAVEYAPRITVNCVAPGWVLTEMSETAYRDGGADRIARTIPLGRIASAADIAGPILFLCSPLARHMTGEVLNVNGGSVMCG